MQCTYLFVFVIFKKDKASCRIHLTEMRALMLLVGWQEVIHPTKICATYPKFSSTTRDGRYLANPGSFGKKAAKHLLHTDATHHHHHRAPSPEAVATTASQFNGYFPSETELVSCSLIERGNRMYGRSLTATSEISRLCFIHTLTANDSSSHI